MSVALSRAVHKTEELSVPYPPSTPWVLSHAVDFSLSHRNRETKLHTFTHTLSKVEFLMICSPRRAFYEPWVEVINSITEIKIEF